MLELLTAGPKKVTSNFKVASYDGGKYNLAVVESGGSLWFLGTQNASGDMGSGDTSNPVGWYRSPIDNVQDVWKNGTTRTIVRKKDGTIWYCGLVTNRYQMGVDTGANNVTITTWTDISSAMPVPLSQIKYVKPGYTSTVVLTTDGRVFWCGTNTNGHFGNGGTASTQVFTETPLTFFAKDIHVCPEATSSLIQTSIIVTDTGLGYAAGSNSNKLVNSSSTSAFTSYTSMTGNFTFNKIALSTQVLIAHVTNTTNASETLVYSGYNAIVGGSSTSASNLSQARGAAGGVKILPLFGVDYTGQQSVGNAVLYTLQNISTGIVSAICAGSSARNITNTATLQTGVQKSWPPPGELNTNVNFNIISLGGPSTSSTYCLGCIFSDTDGDRLYGLGPIFGQSAMDNAPFVRYAWPVVTPTPVPAPTISKMVSTGSSGNEALGVLMSDGSFYTRGRATNGKLGNGSTTADVYDSWYKAATSVTDVWGGGNTFLLKKATGYTTFGSGAPFGLTTDNLTETALPSAITGTIDMSTVTKICMSVESALFLGGSGGTTVYGTGTNTNGSLGTATTNITSPMSVGVNMKSMSMSAATSYLINTGGRLFAAGDNTYNQLGDGTTTTRKSHEELLVNGQSGIVSSIVAGLTGAHIMTTDGTVYGVGAYIYGQGSARLTTPTAVTLPTSTNGYSLTLPPLGNTASVVNNGDKTAYYGRSSLGPYYGLATNTSDAYVAFGTSFDHTKTTGFVQLSNSSWFLNDGKLYHAGNQTITDTYNSTVVDATYTQVVGP